MDTKKIKLYTHKQVQAGNAIPPAFQTLNIDVEQVRRLSDFALDGDIDDDEHFIVSGKIIKKAMRFRDKERSARQVLDKVSEAVFILDRADEVVWANQSARKATNHPKNTIFHKDIYNLFSNAQFPGPIFIPTSQCRKTGEVVVAEFYDDQGKYYEMEVSPWLSPLVPGGKSLLVTVRDITTQQSQLRNLCLLHVKGNELNEIQPQDLRTMTRTQRVELLADGIFETAKGLMHYEMLELRVVNPDSQTLDLLIEDCMQPEVKTREVKIATYGYGINGYVAATRRSYICPDTENDPLYISGGVGSRSSITVPILFQKTLMGVFNVESRHRDAFSKNDLMYLEIFARDIAVVLNTFALLEEERKRALQTSVEEIHKTIAMPASNILNESRKLEPFTEESLDMQVHLYNIMVNAKAIRKLVYRIGAELEGGQVSLAELAVEKERNNILYVDGTDKYRTEVQDILSKSHPNIHHIGSGPEAVRMVLQAFDDDAPYYAILVSMTGVAGYPNCLGFMDEAAMPYAQRGMTPPFVLLQKEDLVNAEDLLAQAYDNHPNCQRVVLPYGIHTLPDAVRRVSGELYGQRILLLDPKKRDLDSLGEMFRRRGCDLEIVTTGKTALADINDALRHNMPYIAVMVAAMDIEDYTHKTDFIRDLASTYAEQQKVPPLVIVRELMAYDSSHVIANVREMFTNCGIVGVPYTEQPLMETIIQVVRNSKIKQS